jgi:heptosyltransferase-2
MSAVPSRTLVIQTAHLGDVVLTLPLIARLAERHGPVDVVTTPVALPLVETHPGVGRAVAFDKHGGERGPGGLLRLGRRLRATPYERVYLPHRSLRSAILGRLTGAGERIGFSDGVATFLYSQTMPRPRRGHMAARLLSLAGASALPPRPWLRVTAEDRARAGAWLKDRGLGESFMVLAPGARWGTKRWPYFGELASRLEAPTVILGGMEDALLGAAIARAAPGRAHSAAGQLTLRESAVVIERAALSVTNDSVALHLTSALARPVVALFGPTSPTFGFGPVDEGEFVVEHPTMPCRPCSHHGPRVCPLSHHRCMRDIAVERVLAAIADRLHANA